MHESIVAIARSYFDEFSEHRKLRSHLRERLQRMVPCSTGEAEVIIANLIAYRYIAEAVITVSVSRNATDTGKVRASLLTWVGPGPASKQTANHSSNRMISAAKSSGRHQGLRASEARAVAAPPQKARSIVRRMANGLTEYLRRFQ